MSEMLSREKFDETLYLMNHPDTDAEHFVQFHMDIKDHDALLRQQLTEAREEVGMYKDVVPRSRYDACNADRLEALAKLKHVQEVAAAEIERLTARLAACENLTTMQDGGIRGLHTQIADLVTQLDTARQEIERLKAEGSAQ